MLKRVMMEHNVMPEFLKVVSAFRSKTINTEGSYVAPFQRRQDEARVGMLTEQNLSTFRLTIAKH